MRVAVLGAGVIGVATAYELWRDGHEVVVVDRAAEPASGTSFANAGMIAPGHAYAWSSPKALRTLARALLRDDLALALSVPGRSRVLALVLAVLSPVHERAGRRQHARARSALCRYSQDRLHAVVAETGVAYGARKGGALYLYRDAGGLSQAAARRRSCATKGSRSARSAPDEAAAHRPGLRAGARPLRRRLVRARATRAATPACLPADLPNGWTRAGSSSGWARLCRDRDGVRPDGGRTDRARTARRRRLRAGARLLERPFGRAIGLDLPVYPIKGYSVTLPIEGRQQPADPFGRRRGQSVRVRQLRRPGADDRDRRVRRLGLVAPAAGLRADAQAARELFPAAGNYDKPEYWAGLRPMTPDNLPIFGRGRLANLWVNTGHGHMGWTWACGSARITADLVAGRTPEHDVATHARSLRRRRWRH